MRFFSVSFDDTSIVTLIENEEVKLEIRYASENTMESDINSSLVSSGRTSISIEELESVKAEIEKIKEIKKNLEEK